MSTTTTTDVGLKFQCDQCGQRFTRIHNLKSHRLTHTGERPFECDKCPAKFRRIHDLKRHVRLHTGERPHECEKCGRRFSRTDALTRHTRISNSCGDRPLGADMLSPIESPTTSGGTGSAAGVQPGDAGVGVSHTANSTHRLNGSTSTVNTESKDSPDAQTRSDATALSPLDTGAVSKHQFNAHSVVDGSSPPHFASESPSHQSTADSLPRAQDPWQAIIQLQAHTQALEQRLVQTEARLHELEKS